MGLFFYQGMLKTVMTVVVCIAIGLASMAFLFIYLVVCAIRRLAQTSTS